MTRAETRTELSRRRIVLLSFTARYYCSSIMHIAAEPRVQCFKLIRASRILFFLRRRWCRVFITQLREMSDSVLTVSSPSGDDYSFFFVFLTRAEIERTRRVATLGPRTTSCHFPSFLYVCFSSSCISHSSISSMR